MLPGNLNMREVLSQARAIASDWHGGQASPLYALASTGTVLPDAPREVRECLATLGRYPEAERAEHRADLEWLLAFTERHARP